jgi:hypothetical protein
MNTEDEIFRGEYWEEPIVVECNVVKVWGFLVMIKEKIKDFIYEISK